MSQIAKRKRKPRHPDPNEYREPSDQDIFDMLADENARLKAMLATIVEDVTCEKLEAARELLYELD